MAKRVKIIGVNGNMAKTEDGKSLRIIGNVRPGSYGWTDGTVIYGYGVPSPYAPPPTQGVPLFVPCFIGGEWEEAPTVWDSSEVLSRAGSHAMYRPNKFARVTYDARCPHWLWDKSRMFEYETAGYITFRNTVVYDIRNSWMRYWKDGHAWFQNGDYSPYITETAYVYTDNYSEPVQRASLDARADDSEEAMRVTQTNLSFNKDSPVANSNVADALDTLLNDFLTNEVPASEYGFSEWCSFVMCDSPTYTYRDDGHLQGNIGVSHTPTANCGWRRFRRIADNRIVTWVDAVAITYVPDTDRPLRPWYAQFVRFRLCVQFTFDEDEEVVATTVLYKRRTQVWAYIRGSSDYIVSWIDSQYPYDEPTVIDDTVSVNLPYIEDLGDGYIWNSHSKYVYDKDGVPVDSLQYERVVGVRNGRVLGQTRNAEWGYREDDSTSDLWWCFGGERLEYDRLVSVWTYPYWMDMYTIEVFK